MRNHKRVETRFEADTSFELTSLRARNMGAALRFSELQNALLGREVEETVQLPLKPLLKLAANEAAGLGWTTGYPLLVFPVLFAEKVRSLRLQTTRQEGILTRGGSVSC